MKEKTKKWMLYGGIAVAALFVMRKMGIGFKDTATTTYPTHPPTPPHPTMAQQYVPPQQHMQGYVGQQPAQEQTPQERTPSGFADIPEL